MALVTVTGNAWDHSRQVIPATLMPRLFARPVDDQIAGGLFAGVMSRASLHPTSGAFSVRLESDLDYRMVMDWLIPGQESELPEYQARDFAEWPIFNSAGGGTISTLFPPRPTGRITAELGAPPPSASGLVWIDLTNVNSDGALVYAPEGN